VWAVDTAGNAASISGTFSITQTPVTAPPPTDYTIWIVLSAAIVVAALAVLVLRRRKKS